MGENKNSFFDKILLKNIDEEIPVNVNPNLQKTQPLKRKEIASPSKEKKANSSKA